MADFFVLMSKDEPFPEMSSVDYFYFLEMLYIVILLQCRQRPWSNKLK